MNITNTLLMNSKSYTSNNYYSSIQGDSKNITQNKTIFTLDTTNG